MGQRWKATVYYRTDTGLVDVVHDLNEMEDLHNLVEAGPHWDTIERIEIVRGGVPIKGLTVEGAEKL